MRGWQAQENPLVAFPSPRRVAAVDHNARSCSVEDDAFALADQPPGN